MKFKQDGERLPDYVAETRQQIRRTGQAKGAGGLGLHEAAEEARRRGVGPDTPAMAPRRAQDGRAADQPGEPGAEAMPAAGPRSRSSPVR